MPELPEVETIKNELIPHVVGHRITGIDLLWKGIVRQPPPEEFCSRLAGQKVTGVQRRGKYLIFTLGHGVWILHLKMSGSLLVKPAWDKPDKYTRAIFHLNQGTGLYFRDVRKLGVMWLVQDENEIVGKLGPEPLEDAFTPQVLADILSRRSAPIKALLCDQEAIAGIGNMYADEALFAARINPLRRGGSLSREEIERLHHAIKEVLLTAIGNKGASILNYYRPGGELGSAHFDFKVAHRRDEPCPVCGTPIERIAIRNRGTYFCPKCQPLP